MNKRKYGFLFSTIYGLMAVIVIVGAYLKLNGYPYGQSFIIIGTLTGLITLVVENFLLKKRLKRFVKETNR